MKMVDECKKKNGVIYRNLFCYLAAQELDGFAKILEAEGVIVRRPDVGPGDFSQSYETPDFKVRTFDVFTLNLFHQFLI